MQYVIPQKQKTAAIQQIWKHLHHRFVFKKRANVLFRELYGYINADMETILDIGCGDGSIGNLIQENDPRLKILGIDSMARPRCKIPFLLYDGKTIPFDDNSFDTCVLVDVLHHVAHPEQLLAEARRVSRKYILIKDHQYKNSFDIKTLRFMDKVGNRPHGVALAYNYLKESEWEGMFNNIGLIVMKRKTSIPLYPFPFSLLFGRQLHFISLLKVVK